MSLKISPDFPEARCTHGALLYALGDTNAAIREIKESIRLKPNYPPAHLNLAGCCYCTPGMLDASIDSYRLRPA